MADHGNGYPSIARKVQDVTVEMPFNAYAYIFTECRSPSFTVTITATAMMEDPKLRRAMDYILKMGKI